jgi:hypothetical protein
MITKINPLIAALYSEMISKEEFIREYFKDVPCSNEYVSELIEKGIENKNGIVIEEAVVLLYTSFFSINLFAIKLCELLQYAWHKKHEDIAMLLKEIENPNTVGCLYKVTELKFDYLDYDDTYQFARKCVKALSAIGTQEAIDKLKLLTSSKTTKIAEYARKELRYKEL